ncbi:uncharacterized protein LOC143022005 [Oratosquilla oratoria]|uniref:uncharacterized protein LOC143022005 n=1 Tax=Oratosquilla oratoria TaxID=337810 RepID=UPI003F76DA43
MFNETGFNNVSIQYRTARDNYSPIKNRHSCRDGRSGHSNWLVSYQLKWDRKTVPIDLSASGSSDHQVNWRAYIERVNPLVPQGSVVAPLLFTLLLAGVGKGVRSDTVVTAYADDIALWRKSRHRRPQQSSANHQAEVRTFQKQVDVVVNHLSNLGFTLSATKTVYMPVHGIGLNRRQYPEWNQVTVCGMAVKPSASVCYLGVIFQCDGRWNKHLQQVCLSARWALNPIRAIRREKWGQRRETLIPIIQNLMRSRLLFGAPALHDLPKTAVEKIAQGVPQAQVYNEAGLLPLWHRLKRDACTYLLSSARVPNSTDEEMYEIWNSASTPVPIHGLPVSVRELCKTAKIQPDERRQIAQCQVDPFPPWALTPPEVELDLPGLSRLDDPHMLAACAREMITQATVFSDSISSLAAIQNASCPSRPDILKDVLSLSTEADRLGVLFRLQWIPSHVGLHGNEMADNAAKLGASSPEDGVIPLQPSANDIFRRIDLAAWDLWKLP